jgi:hypothetical protein
MDGLGLAPRPARRRQAPAAPVVREPCFTREDPPLAMGCAVCGHPPYAHGCSAVGAHEYEVPSAELMAERLSLYVALGLHRRRMSEAEFRRDHACAPAPEQASGELDAVRPAEKPLDGPAAAVSAATPLVEVAAEQDATTPHAPESQTRDDVRRIAAVPPPRGRRRPVLRRSSGSRSGALARALPPRAATRAHTPDASSRQRSQGRVFPPNRPEPVGWHQPGQIATRGGVR